VVNSIYPSNVKDILMANSGSMDMPQIISDFEARKAIEIILYIANRVPNLTKLTICKLIFFADKTSLEKYGRFISGDFYAAMPYGPVPSQTYDLIKEGVGEKTGDFKLVGNHILPLRDADREWFSESDIECLDEVVSKNRLKPGRKITEESHQDLAYQEAWSKRGSSNSVPMEIERIASFFNNSEALVSYLSSRYNE
jgi:uncharacterized phage-associated protein